MGPNEKPQELSYKLEKNTYATVTPMGNWNAMRDDRNRWREVAELLAENAGRDAQQVYESMIDNGL